MALYRVSFKGQTFTHSSARRCTHLVVGRPNHARDLERAGALRTQALRDHAHYTREANAKTRRYGMTASKDRECQRALGMTADAYAESRIAERLAGIERGRLTGIYEQFVILGWYERLVVAEKVAARSAGYYLDVTILPVPAE